MLKRNRTTTASRVRELLAYNKRSGVFTWRVKRGGDTPAGSVAGRIDGRGYRQIGVDNVKYMAAVLAVLYVKGEWPGHDVDHRNRVRDDNRWCNLRELTHEKNCHNNSMRTTNTSGRTGVHKEKYTDKWCAYITRSGVRRTLGRFTNFREACRCRAQAESLP